MDWIHQLDMEKFLLFTLVLSRVSGLMMTAPVYGTQDIPMQIRGLLSVSLAVLLLPSQWHVAVDYPGTTVNYLVFIGAELLVGLCLGLGIVVLFSGVQMAGQLIGRIGGMMLADIFDPATGASVPLISRMLLLIATAVFVCLGGHRVVMAALLDTFETIPPGSATVPLTVTEAFVVLVHESFVLGVRAAAPVVTALLLSTLVMGLISRTMPQLNILAVGFGLNAMLSYGVLALSLGAAIWVFQGSVEPTLDLLLESLHLPANWGWFS